MLKNYFKIAWRNIKRRPIFSVINITGLAIGLAACIIIGLWVQQQLSYDQFHKKSDYIYRLDYHLTYPGGEATLNTLPVPLGDVLNHNYPNIKQTVRVSHSISSKVIKNGNQLFDQKNYMVADPGFFNMFTFPLVQGNSNHLLTKPGAVVLTKTTAHKFFPDSRAVGQILKVDGKLKTVTGVVADPPPNSSLHFSFIETSRGTRQSTSKSWGRNSVSIYVLLSPKTETNRLQSSISQLVSKRKGIKGKKGYSGAIYLQPLTGIHLGRGVPYKIHPYPNSAHASGNATYVWLFVALALFILLLASINYINLATARSSERAREVGIRKTLGAGRWGLARQFIGEATVTCLLSLLLAFVVV